MSDKSNPHLCYLIFSYNLFSPYTKCVYKVTLDYVYEDNPERKVTRFLRIQKYMYFDEIYSDYNVFTLFFHLQHTSTAFLNTGTCFFICLMEVFRYRFKILRCNFHLFIKEKVFVYRSLLFRNDSHFLLHLF